MALTQVQGQMIAPSTTLTTPIVATTMGVGGATPSGSGSGISFPATQSASSDANTLDDYEEGTWTPAFQGSTSSSGQTYNYQYGYYIKIGKMVFVRCDVNLTTAGTNTGTYAYLTGFPFAGAGSAIQFAPVAGYYANFGTASATVSLEMDAGSTFGYLMYTNTGAGSQTFASASFIGNNCRLVFQGCYQTTN
jgi:hypothetical protein